MCRPVCVFRDGLSYLDQEEKTRCLYVFAAGLAVIFYDKKIFGGFGVNGIPDKIKSENKCKAETANKKKPLPVTQQRFSV